MRRTLTALAVAAALATGCASDRGDEPPVKASNLTAGMAKKTIVKGTTTQAQVMEVFGPPDLLTHRDGMEIWTYDKVRYDVKSSGSYLTVLLAGAGESKASSSSTSTMLIIYFNADDVVQDYRLNVTRF